MKKSLKFNVLINLVRYALSVAFPLITVPYITNTLSIEDYGKINFSASIVSYFSIVASFGINTYAIRTGAQLRNDKKKLKQFACELFTINLCTTFLSYNILFIFLKYFINLRVYKNLILIQSISILLTTIGCDWINNIFEDYIWLTVRSFLVQIGSLITMFIFVKDETDYINYVVIIAMANGLANFINLFYVAKYIKIKPVLIRNNNYIKRLIPFFINQVAIIIFVSTDIIVLGIIRNETEVAIYSLAVKIYSVVKEAVYAGVIATLPRISNEFVAVIKEEKADRLESIFNLFFVAVIPVSTGLIGCGRSIIDLLSDEAYTRAFYPLAILGFAVFFANLATLYVTCIILPANMEKITVFVSVISAVVNFVINIFAIPRFGYIAAAISTLISELICMVMYSHYSKRIIQIKIDRMVMSISIAGGCIILMICGVTYFLFGAGLLQIIESFILGGLLYLLLFYVVKRNILIEYMPVKLRKIFRKSD